MTQLGTPEWRSLPAEIEPDELRVLTTGVHGPVALTGATGFIGSHLAEALIAAGVEVRALVRSPARLEPSIAAGAEIILGDLDDLEAVTRLVHGVEVVFHLAGRLRAPSEDAFDRTNRAATERLVATTATRSAQALFVYVSSLAATGPAPDPSGRDPDDEPRPISAYGRSKLGGELAVRRGAERWVIVRPPAVYGPRDIDVLQFFKLAARGLVPLPSGERWVTIAHVTDVVRGLIATMGAAATGRVFHLGEPRSWRLDDVIREIARAGGVKARLLPLPTVLVRTAGGAGNMLQLIGFRNVALTTDKAREMLARHWTARTDDSLAALGLRGFVPLASGAAHTWDWYRERGWVSRAKITPA